jgi:predicted DNA-binding ribbon-helix-helix protein
MHDNHSVRVGRLGSTRINVEPLIWQWLREIATIRSISLSQLMAEIERTRRLEIDENGKRHVRTLSSAVRVYVTEYIASNLGK